jgi:hypothetical protein
VTDFDRAALLAELERFHGARLLYGNLPPDLMTKVREALGETAPAEAPAEAPPDKPL